MTPIVIVGSSGHAGVVIDIIETQGKYHIAGLLDRFRAVGEETRRYIVLGAEEDLPTLVERHGLMGILVAIGDNAVRQRVVSGITSISPGLQFVTAVHPRACVADGVELGPGTIVMPGVTINAGCRVGSHCLLNTHSSLDHDSTMADFSSLAPGVTVGGKVRIGEGAALCIGATVVHGISVGEHTVLGAGATLLTSVPGHKLVYGTPARIIRDRVVGDAYL